MTGMEGQRPTRKEAAFKAGPPGGGETGNQGTPHSAESRILSLVSTVQRPEGEPLDPYRISYALMDYQDKVYATRRGAILVPKPGESYQTVKHTRELTEADDTFLQTIMRVRDAFDIDAFFRYPQGYQQTLSEEVYDADLRMHRPDESFTLTDEEKGILRQVIALAGLPDDPDQCTYTYGTIPHIVEAQ